MNNLLIYGDLSLDKDHVDKLNLLQIKVTTINKNESNKIVIKNLKNSQYLIFNNVNINPFIPYLKNIKLSILAASGYEFINTDVLKKYGIKMTNIRDYSTPAVVEFLFWSILSISRNLIPFNLKYEKNKFWDKSRFLGRELPSLKFGILGLGTIGKSIGDRLALLGAPVYFSSLNTVSYRNFVNVSKRDLFCMSDFILICCSQNTRTYGLVNKDLLKLTKHNCGLISIAPKGVIEINHLLKIFNSNTERRAIIDIDPIVLSKDFDNLGNVMFTPHMAFFSKNSLRERINKCISLLEKSLLKKEIEYI